MSAISAVQTRHALWTSRLPKRWTAIVLCGVLLALASCGPHAAVITARAPVQLAPQSWEQIALPTPVSETQDFVVSPVNPALLFDCTADPMTLWRSTDT